MGAAWARRIADGTRDLLHGQRKKEIKERLKEKGGWRKYLKLDRQLAVAKVSPGWSLFATVFFPIKEYHGGKMSGLEISFWCDAGLEA